MGGRRRVFSVSEDVDVGSFRTTQTSDEQLEWRETRLSPWRKHSRAPALDNLIFGIDDGISDREEFEGHEAIPKSNYLR